MDELSGERPRLAELRRRARNGPLTLVYSARDSEHNDAVVLAEILRRGLQKPRSSRDRTTGLETTRSPDRRGTPKSDAWKGAKT